MILQFFWIQHAIFKQKLVGIPQMRLNDRTKRTKMDKETSPLKMADIKLKITVISICQIIISDEN